ncbi:hypothetical protein DDZ14_03850 [Maritimibacter sp. 55A14]|uniref:hypothetical protein n=1 Tax=Maritimibacter sp. 55A14 TaxID=2174844 RepID=UPI000D60B7C6|nr:hypothetical protein [Maritimibacter sp. 55A14]PWE33806.1 hypothetical protein DDZ14_03850 [Maritimibacter sp. 55A14]
MIRVLLLMLGIGLGLSAVLATELRMGHLRRFAPEAVPDWTAPIDDPAQLGRGQADAVALPGLPVPAALGWRFARLGADGAVWDVTLNATGMEAAADLRLPPAWGVAHLDAGRGEIALTDLPPVAEGMRAGGLIRIETFDARIDYAAPALEEASAQARWLGAELDGIALGEGEISLVSGGSGGWRAPFALTGDLVEVVGRIEGRFGQRRAVLEMTVKDAGAMPEAWKRALSRNAARGDAGWTIRREVDLGATWPLF